MNIKTTHTLNDLFDLYLKLYSSSRSPHTIKTKISYWNKYVKNDIGLKYVHSLNFIDYQIFLNNLLKHLKPKSVKNIKHDIQVVVNIAVRLGIIKENPLKYIELPKFDNKIYLDLPVELQKKIFQDILNYDEPIYRNIFLFLAHGRRLNEALSLKWKHVDLENEIYYIPSSINKAKRDMSYQMTTSLKLALEIQKQFAQIYNYYELENFVFFNPKTKNRYKDVRKAWKRFLKKNSLPKLRIHDLRHLVGTYSINVLEIPIEKVSHTLGHTDIHTTQRYITKRPNSAKEVMENIFNSIEERL